MNQDLWYKIVFILIYFLLINGVFIVAGQDDDLPVYYYPHKIYTVKNGMSQTLVNSVYQDKKGFIWAGTKEGVNRFDGLKFENHTTNSNYPNDRIIRIHEDNEDNLWVEGHKGLYRYRNDTFINFIHYLPDSLKNKKLKIFSFDEENNFWFGSYNCKTPLYFLTKQKRYVAKKIKTKVSGDNWISQMITLSDGSFIFLSGSGLNPKIALWINSNGEERVILRNEGQLMTMRKIEDEVYILSGNRLYLFKNGTLSLKKALKRAIGIYTIKDKKLYIHTEDGFYFYEKENSTLIKAFDRPFNTLAVTDEEIIITDVPGSKVFRWYKNKWINYGFNFAEVIRLFFDKKNMAWLGTEEGLIKIYNEAIQIFSLERGMLPSTWSMVEDTNGDYWLSSHVYDHGIQKLTKNMQYEVVKGYENYIPSKKNRFYPGAMKTSDNELLFPTNEKVIVYNENTKFRELKYSKTENFPIQDIKETNGTYYLATKGLKIIYKNDSSLFYSDEDGLDMAHLDYIEAIEKDTQNIWWLTSNFGLATFDGKNFKNYYVNEDLKAGISCVYKDYKNNLWFGSQNGLLIHDYSGDLPCPVWKEEITGSVKFITSIDTSYLVLGMLDKLLFIDLQKHYRDTLDYFVLDEENGFEGEDCIMHSDFTDSQGNIWFATRTNVMKLIPSELKLTNTPTPLRYESVTFKLPEDASYQKSRLTAKDNEPISLKSTHSFQVNFYTINHTNPKKMRYQYMLEGYENDWSPPSPQRYANYSNLPVGKYKLKVKTVLLNKESEINELALKILPGKWHQAKWVTPTAIFLFLSIISTAFYLVYRVRKDRKKTQKELLLKELKELKTRHKLLLNQTNPHFTFNIMNHITALVKKGELLDIRRYIGMFGELFRPMLRNDGKLMWTLKEEMEFVDSYLQLEKLRFPDKFEYTITVNNYVNTFTLIPKMTIQSFVNNAIKHGIEPKKSKDGKIEVSISQKGDFIYIFIEDNGIGFPDEGQNLGHSKGSGIRTLRNTLDWLNEHYSVQSSVRIENIKDPTNKSTGAKVTLELFTRYESL